MSKMAFVDETPVVYDGIMETLRQRRGLEMDDTSEDNEILKLSGREMLDEHIEKAIKYIEGLIDLYDLNMDITDEDLCHIIEILKGRE